MSYLVRISSQKQVIEFEEAAAVTAPTESASLMEFRLGDRIFAFETQTISEGGSWQGRGEWTAGEGVASCHRDPSALPLRNFERTESTPDFVSSFIIIINNDRQSS